MKVHEINPAEMADYSISVSRTGKIPLGAQIALGLTCYISHKQMDAMKAENASLRNIIENVSNIIELIPNSASNCTVENYELLREKLRLELNKKG
jgi:hypothetical protein